MAVGDTKTDIQTIATTARMTIQPASGEEWILLNVFREANVTIERFDGTLRVPFLVITTNTEAPLRLYIRLTNGDYITVQNNDAGSKNIGYDALQVK